MSGCDANQLLREGAAATLGRAYSSYSFLQDDLLDEVHRRLNKERAATKLDLGALVFWKHIRNSPWMTSLMRLPEVRVREATAMAMSDGLTDLERINALAPLPGFGGGGAMTSVFLSAWRPEEYGVYDRLAKENYSTVVVESCHCNWVDLPTYFMHLRRIVKELPSDDWTPRHVDMALFRLKSVSQ